MDDVIWSCPDCSADLSDDGWCDDCCVSWLDLDDIDD